MSTRLQDIAAKLSASPKEQIQFLKDQLEMQVAVSELLRRGLIQIMQKTGVNPVTVSLANVQFFDDDDQVGPTHANIILYDSPIAPHLGLEVYD